MNAYSRKGWIGRFLPLIKISTIILVIILPVLLLVVIFTPIVSKKNTTDLFNYYRLPENFTSDDVVQTVANMSRDKEFMFYFYALGQERVLEATSISAEILRDYPGKNNLRKKIDELKERIDTLSRLFYYLEFPKDFVRKPEEYADLNDVMWKFLFEEFKLAILGVCYKATYDAEFIFEWDPTTRLAAQKLEKLVLEIKKSLPEDQTKESPASSAGANPDSVGQSSEIPAVTDSEAPVLLKEEVLSEKGSVSSERP